MDKKCKSVLEDELSLDFRAIHGMDDDKISVLKAGEVVTGVGGAVRKLVKWLWDLLVGGDDDTNQGNCKCDNHCTDVFC